MTGPDAAALGDPVPLLADLIRRPSVTPTDAGALDVLQDALSRLGFVCHRLPFSEPGTPEVDNLYARFGTDGPNLCFAGHTDVVPVGDPADWTHDPFGAEIADDRMYGRGAVDMKGAIAAFVAGFARVVAEGGPFKGSVSFLITGDEEGPAVNGTIKVLHWLAERGERLDACIVGEPTNPAEMGEMIKIGRRGSYNGRLKAFGVQGHVAYPDQADNPVHRMIRLLDALVSPPLDQGTEHFQPSGLQVTTVDVGNPTTNLIPATVSAGFNVRFNDLWSGRSLDEALRRRLDACGSRYELTASVSGESFLTAPGPLSDALVSAIERVCGAPPELSTSGGTSDARFIKDHCPVIECGLVNEMAHKVDENVRLDDLDRLTQIYALVLRDHLAGR
ncbi:succinyl-diaminopimelate desuccinylase [Constrictibacter sp. MBR-5]|jgi:succinyl-diaminopimelate desuccinylase|uniref:succinyl-diaminopimelate desuccinylase n=1 Tax=Constrictibacter sp. MBR-5 TaxID=3156467 RepID=UPI00339357F1